MPRTGSGHGSPETPKWSRWETSLGRRLSVLYRHWLTPYSTTHQSCSRPPRARYERASGDVPGAAALPGLQRDGRRGGVSPERPAVEDVPALPNLPREGTPGAGAAGGREAGPRTRPAPPAPATDRRTPPPRGGGMNR